MDVNLMTLTVEELLHKFGAGSHKPGSGSAAALSGMLSVKLTYTVISLTTDSKREHLFKEWISQFKEYQAILNDRIFPELTKLFKEDSKQFDKVINLRSDRDNEKVLAKKCKLENKHLEELKISIDIPIKIAKLCVELADIAIYTFNHGFQAARGDTLVALNNAVAAITGCIAIIDLNLLSFKNSEWTNEVRIKLKELRDTCKSYNQQATECNDALAEESRQRDECQKKMDIIVRKYQKKSFLTNSQIEDAARELQLIVYQYQNALWHKEREDPLTLLRPEVVLKKSLGFQVERAVEIDKTSSSEVAGILNQVDKTVFISKNFPREVQNFTLAHELGHILFHDQPILHRDIALDGTRQADPKNIEEYQADKFAAYFLMPAKQVKSYFRKYFYTNLFVINQDNAFRLINQGPVKLRKRFKNIQELSRFLVTTDSFGPNKMKPLHQVFGVSIGAMAIRLEELNLIEF